MFDLSFEKLLIIGFLALILVGPERLPHYAAQLAKWAKVARSMVDGAKERVRDELGPEYEDVDWARLDPRQYDPRRIIRDALLEEPTAPPRRRSWSADGDVADAVDVDAGAGGRIPSIAAAASPIAQPAALPFEAT